MTQPSGWYDDPNDADQLRYWDGVVWTDHAVPRKSPTVEQSRIGMPHEVSNPTPLAGQGQQREQTGWPGQLTGRVSSGPVRRSGRACSWPPAADHTRRGGPHGVVAPVVARVVDGIICGLVSPSAVTYP